MTGDDESQTTKTIQLQDGRKLGYAEYCALHGRPLLHFHGWPGSRLEARLVAEPAARAGVRLIGVDRPGMGLSDFMPGRTILDWVDDVVELVDALGQDRFAIEGISSGGVYAIACAYKIPHRLTACSIISGMGPFEAGLEGMKFRNRSALIVAKHTPWLLRPLLWGIMGRYRHDQSKINALLLKMDRELPAPDRKLFLNPEVRQHLAAATKEAFRQGTRGLAYDGRLLTQPWGFRLGDITCNNIYLWHGVLDVDVPVSMARFVADAIPDCRARFFPQDGHISVPYTYPEEIWATMDFC
ncbi:MAG: alpha/beta hydrolase [Anaerolineales bacterium]|nr:alpha/beta hydrolase [Anaerolineales bacterium]